MTFEILGIPKPKQSFRFTKQGRRYQTKEVKEREQSIQWQVITQLPDDFVPFDCPLKMEAEFIFPIPSGFSKKKRQQLEEGEVFYKITKPDLTDNLMKGVCDAMEGVVFINDSRIAKIQSVKKYGMFPKTIIKINQI